MSYKTFILPKTGSMTGDIVVYTEFKENWQYFFNEPTMTPAAIGAVDKVLTVRAHTVSRGPGDPSPYTRGSTQRFYAKPDGLKGSARPGRTWKVGEEDPLGDGYMQLREFAIKGTILNMKAYAKNKAKFQITLWAPSGRYWVIPGATGQPAVLGNP